MRENKVTVFVGVPQIFALIERTITDQMKKFAFFVELAKKVFMGIKVLPN